MGDTLGGRQIVPPIAEGGTALFVGRRGHQVVHRDAGLAGLGERAGARIPVPDAAGNAGRSFGVSSGTPGRLDAGRLAPIPDELHDRLAGVVIERLPYAELLACYDSPATLFYLDPPYWGSETDYGTGVFSRDDFARLAAQLSGISGRFILSVNYVPRIREAFAAFDIEAVDLTYTIAGGDGTSAKEIIVTSRGLPREAGTMELFD